MTRTIVTGIDVGTHTVRVLVGEYLIGHRYPKVLAVVAKDSRGLRHGYVVNLDEVSASVGEALSAAENMAKLKLKRAYLAIGGVTLESRTADASVAVSRADQEVTEVDVKRVLELCESSIPDHANRTVIQSYPLAFKLDGKKVLGRPTGFKGGKLEARSIFITCLTQHLNDLENAVIANGIAVEDVIPSPIAASMVTLTKVQRMAGCVLANIGSETTSIAVFEEGIPLSVRVFPIGSRDITNDIALGLKISLDEAERIKTGIEDPGVTHKKLDEIIDARLSDMFELIEAHLKKLGRNGLLPAGIVMTGGGSGVPDIESLAKKALRLPARLGSLENGTMQKMPGADPAWAVAYGLVLAVNMSTGEESRGSQIMAGTKAQILKWFRELLP
ncbi:MAG: Cell division protein ftsA [Parcubacteria group bacterium GW2011_GWF1_52_5]|nr:MAG: Cell division protein ftsA [Parcubacteria group bacterium GW2011_GWF1_52_5]